ncbi:MAG TPA: YdeI/OmpD-associated family protein [Croceibacterium sp.]|nr:YdeI/OmpD-associated family protein [Propylenella sp.]HYD24537.1 YdeI/OmpD-associated family protein [Croceibacterium sp.]
MSTLRFRAELQRKDPGLPVFIRIPGEVVAPWGLNDWRSVEGSLNGHAFGRRTIKDWGNGSADWFVEIVKPYLEAAGLKPGDTVEVELRLANMTMPDEMAARLESDPEFARAFEALIPNHKRKAIEHYLEAKTPAGRTARLDKISRSIKARLAH